MTAVCPECGATVELVTVNDKRMAVLLYGYRYDGPAYKFIHHKKPYGKWKRNKGFTKQRWCGNTWCTLIPKG